MKKILLLALTLLGSSKIYTLESDTIEIANFCPDTDFKGNKTHCNPLDCVSWRYNGYVCENGYNFNPFCGTCCHSSSGCANY